MKPWYTVVPLEGCSIREFAERHHLEMVVTEIALDRWNRDRGRPRWQAQFKRVEVKDGCMLCGELGAGDTPEKAIKDYTKKIAGEVLVYDAYGASRSEIRCPNEWREEP